MLSGMNYNNNDVEIKVVNHLQQVTAARKSDNCRMTFISFGLNLEREFQGRNSRNLGRKRTQNRILLFWLQRFLGLYSLTNNGGKEEKAERDSPEVPELPEVPVKEERKREKMKKQEAEGVVHVRVSLVHEVKRRSQRIH